MAGQCTDALASKAPEVQESSEQEDLDEDEVIFCGPVLDVSKEGQSEDTELTVAATEVDNKEAFGLMAPVAGNVATAAVSESPNISSRDTGNLTSDAGALKGSVAVDLGSRSAVADNSMADASDSTSSANQAREIEVDHWKPSWWDRHMMVQYGHHVTVLNLKLKGLGLADADIPSLCLALDRFTRRNLNPDLPVSVEIDVAENRLADRGGRNLMSWVSRLVLKHPAGGRLRILKMYRNRLSDETCECLARLIAAQPESIEEIHLSHNEIQQSGFTALLVALAMHPGSAYPRWTSAVDACPCWVRLEHNEVTDVERFLQVLEKEPAHLRVCLAPRNNRGQSCTSFQCCVAATPESVAHVHLYCVTAQSDSSSFARGKPERLVRKFATLLSDGKFKPLMTKPHINHGNKSRAVPKDVVPCRSVKLKVDKDRGAGLDLEPGAHGFVVRGIDSEPGQDLSVEDVILEIDGVPLWGSLDEDDLNAAFGSRFANGAILRVGQQASLRGRNLWQPLGLATGIDSLTERCEALRLALAEDLDIMGRRCGVVRVGVHPEEAAVTLCGPPRAQRWAADELLGLVGFYFPEQAALSVLPRCEWFGDFDALCEAPEEIENVEVGEELLEANADGGNVLQDLSAWESALRQQCSEDENLFDDDLPCEPLEAPDDGPDIFEGDILAPDFEVTLPLRLLMLCGLPGSGKSTLAARFDELGWRTVNQDTLGDRRKCVTTAKRLLQAGNRVVIDRCNVSRIQRRVWLGVADEFQVCAGCIWLDTHRQECARRVLSRFGHQTLPADSSSLDVIDAFEERMESPVEAEGFVLWRTRYQAEIDNCIADFLDLAESSEAAYAEVAEAGVPSGTGMSRDEAQRRIDHAAKKSTGFSYRRSHGRGERARYLRAVRRQIEYYFSDANLRQDWFFQEKIAEEPESGWLELRWILSCPRIQNVHRADDADVLESLGPSILIVKTASGTHWIKRGRPPPPLTDPRPPRGEEPDWYRALHGNSTEGVNSSDRNCLEANPADREEECPPTGQEPATDDATLERFHCVKCKQELLRDAFSKSQISKHRKKPTCKECLDKLP